MSDFVEFFRSSWGVIALAGHPVLGVVIAALTGFAVVWCLLRASWRDG